MRLYNRAIIKKRVNRDMRDRIVDRDAVIWEVNETYFFCTVRFQGSNTDVRAHYPRNWTTVPTWLKPGNAVRVRHRSGVQGFVEVVGHGRAIPTPVDDEDLFPAVRNRSDGIESGMEIVPYSGGGMNVIVQDGTYRIADTIYTFTAEVSGFVVMDDPAPIIMGDNTLMGYGDTLVPVVIAAAPSTGYGRYDMLSIGTDGVVDVTTGTPSILTTEPSKPQPETDHVIIGYLFIYGGMTSIPADAIGIEWSAPTAGGIDYTSSMKQADGSLQMAWSAVGDHPEQSITFSVTNQYGQGFNLSKTATFTMMYGTGGVGTSGAGGFGGASSVTATIGSSVTFYYERDQLAAETSPLLKIEIEDNAALTLLLPVVLLDSGGNPI